jgi:DNA-binding transcriptional LysR family regulator
MELRQLRYFVAVAQERSFTKAAAALRVAQPALSRQLQQLEGELGVKLLERDTRSTNLTAAGRAFFREACRLLDQAERAMAIVRQRQFNSATELNIGYVWGLFHSIVPKAVGKFRQCFPDVPVKLYDLSATDLTKALLAGKLDAGFIGFEEASAVRGLATRRIGACQFDAVLPEGHPLARKQRIPLAALATDRFVLISKAAYPGAAQLVAKACQRAGFRPKVLQSAARGFTILDLVASNNCVALLPESLRILPQPGIVFRRLTDPPTGDLYLAWKRAPRRPTRDAFIDVFPELARSHSQTDRGA